MIAGGVLFKVYIVGDTIKVVRGFSLRDVDENASLGYGVIPFPGVSSASASANDADLDPHVGGEVFFCYLLDFTLSYYI